MADAMTGKQFREYVESGGRVFLSPSYGGFYWLIEWTDKEEMLKLAELLENEEGHRTGLRAIDPRRFNEHDMDYMLDVEFVSESHLDPEPPDDETELSDKSILTLNLRFE
jgi:hypothetical protein